ncbi:MAG: (Fe-S)-binding protein [Desulfuromusa sp.]|jgi:Fe-S oxidoreductase|nr:(Fe-S)-binding protein [Desulfuromusa sp.]
MAFPDQQKSRTKHLSPALDKQLLLISEKCTQCQACVRECAFLSRHGSPKNIADSYNPDERQFLDIPFKCSLCNLCSAVCPEEINPAEMFLEMRREAFDRGAKDLSEHRRLRNFEKKGTSKRFSWYALPEDCDTIFFPGCALSGSRSETTLKVFEQLQKKMPSIGIVLDCCTKPSHDLGDEDHFNAMFGEMKDYLLSQGIKTVLLACPNCHLVFSRYGSELQPRTIYEELEQIDFPAAPSSEAVTIHDPCTARFNLPAQDAVRRLLKNKNLQIEELPHSGKKTFCCGEGGAVNFLAPELATHWGQKRIDEANGRSIVSYCSACTEKLGAQTQTSHILDLLFDENAKIAKPPLTYFKRLKLKKYLQDNFQATVTRERTFQGTSKYQLKKSIKLHRLILTGSLVLLSLFFISQAWTL